MSEKKPILGTAVLWVLVLLTAAAIFMHTGGRQEYVARIPIHIPK